MSSAFVEDQKHKGQFNYLPARNDPLINHYPKKIGLHKSRRGEPVLKIFSKPSL